MKLQYAQPHAVLWLCSGLFILLLLGISLPLSLFSGSAGLPRWLGTVVAGVGGIIGMVAVSRFHRWLVRTRFDAWHSEWKKDTQFESSLSKIANHPAYRAIIKMGDQVLPCIFAALNQELEHWFIALEKITGKNPAKDAPAGNLEAMRQAWLAWGRKKGYLKQRGMR